MIAPAIGIVGCESQEASEAPIYDVASVDVRDIQVAVDAAGVLEPEATVEVKSKASGEILSVHADTGDVVEEGDLLVEVDQRTPRNQLAEAEASLVAAQARRRIAETQVERSETLWESGTLTQTDYEQAQLEFANAEAQVVTSQVAVENARIAMEDTSVRAPISGTIIDRQVEPGMVISSPTQAVSDGTILMTMADLKRVQVRTLVDETDIGKVQPGMPATVVVASYPNQPFEGQVLKTEPLAIAEQNVTMFAVLILLENEDGLLMPGMNAQVEIRIASRESVAAVPTAALRTHEDIEATAGMLGMDEARLTRELYGEGGIENIENAASAASAPTDMISVGDRMIELPDGLDAEQIGALIEKRRSGEELTADEQARLRPVLEQVFGAAGDGAPGDGAPGDGEGAPASAAGASASADAGPSDSGSVPVPEATVDGAPEPNVSAYQFGGRYWLVARRNGSLVPVVVQTGLTDLEYTEVMEGVEVGDEVLLLPSTSLYEQQARLQDFISRRFSGGSPFGR